MRTQNVVFNRPKVPARAQGKPELVCSGDGGKSGSAGCVYVRYKTGEDLYEARLLASKARVSSSNDAKNMLKVSSSRNEMSGLVHVDRLNTAIHPGMVDKPSSIFTTGGNPLTSLSDLATTVSNLMTYADEPKKVSKKNPPVKNLVTAVQRLVLLAPADEEQQGPPKELDAPGLPNPGTVGDQFLSRPSMLPHQEGQPEVMPGPAQHRPGSRTSRPPNARVRLQ